MLKRLQYKSAPCLTQGNLGAQKVALSKTKGKPFPNAKGLYLLLLGHLIEPTIDLGDLLHPLLSLGMFESQDPIEWPVEMIGNIRYLLVETIEEVASHPPKLARSISNSCPHSGQFTPMVLTPSSLMVR